MNKQHPAYLPLTNMEIFIADADRWGSVLQHMSMSENHFTADTLSVVATSLTACIDRMRSNWQEAHDALRQASDISPTLAAIIEQYRRATVAARMVEVEDDYTLDPANAPLRAAAHVARTTLAHYPALNRAEAMAKIGAIVPEWSIKDIRAEIAGSEHDPYASLDDVLLSAVADLMHLGEATPCA